MHQLTFLQLLYFKDMQQEGVTAPLISLGDYNPPPVACFESIDGLHLFDVMAAMLEVQHKGICY